MTRCFNNGCTTGALSILYRITLQNIKVLLDDLVKYKSHRPKDKTKETNTQNILHLKKKNQLA